MQRILLTGGNGFVGRHLLQAFSRNDYLLRVTGRTEPGPVLTDHSEYVCIDLAAPLLPPQEKLLEGVDIVIHLAGIAHRKAGPQEYAHHNSGATAKLACRAAAAGVKRFIFMSTAKVYGEASTVTDGMSHPFNEQSAVRPIDLYARSKAEAEAGLIEACSSGNMEYVILRPPLIYGPGVRANFLALLRAVYWRLPLPLGAIDNVLSLVYVGNLCDIVTRLVSHPAAANQIFNVKDYDDSTPGLITRLSHGFGYKPRLLKVSPRALEKLLKMTAPGAINKLIGSFLIDNHKLTGTFDWKPKVDTSTAIQKTVDWFVHRRG